MVGIIELFIVGIVVSIIAFVVMRVVYSKQPGKGADQPVCGSCGYATRGISGLNCPECGANLTEVGIVMPSDRGPGLAGCLPPLGLTVAVILLAVIGYSLLGLIVPQYRQQSTDFDLIPASDEYAQVMMSVDATIITPPGGARSFSSLDLTTTAGTPPVTDVTFGDSSATIRPNRIAIEVMPIGHPNSSGVMTFAPRFQVDPTAKTASWTDAQGNPQTSQGPMSHKHVLAYLGSAGADTGNPDVILEAQQLTDMIDGLMNGTSQFQLQGFSQSGYGAGSSGQLGPIWMLPTYAVAWLLIWIVGLIALAMRSRRAAARA